MQTYLLISIQILFVLVINPFLYYNEVKIREVKILLKSKLNEWDSWNKFLSIPITILRCKANVLVIFYFSFWSKI